MFRNLTEIVWFDWSCFSSNAMSLVEFVVLAISVPFMIVSVLVDVVLAGTMFILKMASGSVPVTSALNIRCPPMSFCDFLIVKMSGLRDISPQGSWA